MKRTSVSLPDELAAAVEREARRRRVPVSRVVREGLETYLGRSGERRTIAFAAIGHSGRQDTARRSEEILAREWADAGHR